MNQHLWAARKVSKLSQQELADAAGCTQQDISRIENDGWIPPAPMRQRLAKVLKVGVEALFPSEVSS